MAPIKEERCRSAGAGPRHKDSFGRGGGEGGGGGQTPLLREGRAVKPMGENTSDNKKNTG